MENNQIHRWKKPGSRKSMDNILKIEHNIHCSYGKFSLDRDRTMQYQKDKTNEDLMIAFHIEKRNVN